MKTSKFIVLTVLTVLSTGCQVPTALRGAEGIPGASGKDGFSAGIRSRAAVAGECLNGGVAIESWTDVDSNLKYDPTLDKNFQNAVICNGSNGLNGTNGTNGINGINGTNGVNGKNGISILSLQRTPSAEECPNGGTAIDVWNDVDGDLHFGAEVDTGFSTLLACNGVHGLNGINGTNGTNGTNGLNGTNGTNGVDGTNGIVSSGAIGPMVSGKPFSACHHDYLYLSNGWLLLRHQANGLLDEGVGSTGFNVWNVDIADFTLVSETMSNDVYCSMHFDKAKKTLSYTVETKQDGLKGISGVIVLK